MNDLFLLVLSLSLSATLLILLLFLLKPLWRGRTSRRWEHYIWLVVIARLLLPFTPPDSPVGALFENRATNAPTAFLPYGEPALPNSNTLTPDRAQPQSPEPLDPLSPQSPHTPPLGSLSVLWLAGAICHLLWRVWEYHRYVSRLRQKSTPVSDPALLAELVAACNRVGIRRPVELHHCPPAPSPLLLGILHPIILIPQTVLPLPDARYTLLHECTHLKHFDLLYKWLVQGTLCLHWFNPFVHLLSWEVNRTCELACDEAVLKLLDDREHRAYGETLLRAAERGLVVHPTPASLALSENGKLLRERLGAIMTYQKKTALIPLTAALLTGVLAFSSLSLGAYALTPAIPPKTADTADTLSTTAPTPGVYYVYTGGATQADRPTSSVTPGSFHFVLVRKGSYVAITPHGKTGTELYWDLAEACRAYTEKGTLTQAETDLLLEKAREVTTGWQEPQQNRTESLVESFAPYAPLGITYDPIADTAHYHGKPVKIFVDLQDAYPGGDYSFHLGYFDHQLEEGLSLLATRGTDGNLSGIVPLPQEMEAELDQAWEVPSVPRTPGAPQAPSVPTVPYSTYDATTTLDGGRATLTDHFSPHTLPTAVVEWAKTAPPESGTVLITSTDGSFTQGWLCYSGQTRRPFSVKKEDDTLNVLLLEGMGQDVDPTFIHFSLFGSYREINLSQGEKTIATHSLA